MKSNALRVLVTPPSGHRPIIERAAAELGLEISLAVLPTDELYAKATAEPDSFDVVQAEFWMIETLCHRRSIQAVPTGGIGPFVAISPLFAQGLVGDQSVSEHGVAPILDRFGDGKSWTFVVPTIANSDTLGWRPDRVDAPIESWGDLLRADLFGQVALADVPAVTHIEISLACQALGEVRYADIGEQTTTEIDATYDVLNGLADRGHFEGVWASFERSVELMTTGPVALQSLWPPAVTALKKQRIAVKYAALREGARGWAGGLCLSSQTAASRQPAAIAYMDWYLGGWAGAYLTRQGYYSSTPQAARRFMTASEWDYWQCGLPAADPVLAPDGAVIGQPGDVREGGSYEQRMSRIICWNVQMKHDAHLRARWNAFRARLETGASCRKAAL